MDAVTITERAALRLIAACGCERVTAGWCGDGVEDWSPYAEYASCKWCHPCIARAGLDGTLPAEPGIVKISRD